MPVTADLFPDLFTPFTNSVVFSEATIEAVEKAVTEKNGKAYVKCLVRGKEVMAKPEEVVRQLWLHTLTTRYKYPLSRLDVEYPITFGRDTSKRADIIIKDADRPSIVYCVIEVKQATVKGGKDQLKSYGHSTGAPLALWSDGVSVVVWHRQDPNNFEEIPSLPRANETIEQVAGQPWTIDKLIEFEHIREREGIRSRTLRQRIQEMEDEVLANAGVDVFEEVFKLIFTKLFDELSHYREPDVYPHLRFRNVNTAAQMKKAIQTVFDEAKERWHGVFPNDDRIKLTPEHLKVCVGALEQWKLFNSNLDVVDDAFEYLVSKSSKGEKGQYFTPRWVIDMCVKMMNPKEDETLIDTACGSAGFTMHSIFHVWGAILEDMGKPRSNLFTLEDKPGRCKKYVREKVFAIDFDEKSVRVSRCLNLIAGDGESNVLHLNTLDYRRWQDWTGDDEENAGDSTWRETYKEGWPRLKKLRAEKKDNRAFKFDVLLANPPFAGDIKQPDMLSPYDLAHKRRPDGTLGKPESAVGRDLLFIERNLDFLKPGGRMAVVLPQGRFNNSSDQRVREFLADKCRLLAVVGLHPNTFKPHTGTKTSVLFVQKWTDAEYSQREAWKAKLEEDWEKHAKANATKWLSLPDGEAQARKAFVAAHPNTKALDYNIFFATQRLPSKDNSGDKIYVRQTCYGGYDTELKTRVYLNEARFKAKFGSLAAATLYEVFPKGMPDRVVEMLKAEIDEKYGSTESAQKQGYTVARSDDYLTRPEILRDEHQHLVVQHDLFNHEGLTQDGIAEAFQEFATKEKLSFF
jgi:type I restriction enzyme M protein